MPLIVPGVVGPMSLLKYFQENPEQFEAFIALHQALHEKDDSNSEDITTEPENDEFEQEFDGKVVAREPSYYMVNILLGITPTDVTNEDVIEFISNMSYKEVQMGKFTTAFVNELLGIQNEQYPFNRSVYAFISAKKIGGRVVTSTFTDFLLLDKKNMATYDRMLSDKIESRESIRIGKEYRMIHAKKTSTKTVRYFYTPSGQKHFITSQYDDLKLQKQKNGEPKNLEAVGKSCVDHL